MKFNISFERVYPHPPKKVWRALTELDALGHWLMETDFVPEVGRSFQMWCENADGGTDRYLGKVIDLEPPSRMTWSWVLDGRQDEGEMLIEFHVEEVPEGTRLTIRHSGEGDPAIIEAFKGGWPEKLDELTAVLSAR